MFEFLLALLVLSILLNIGLILLLKRSFDRLLQMDDAVDYWAEDLIATMNYLTKLKSTSLYANTPEIQDFLRKVGVMYDRYREILQRMSDASGRNLFPEVKSQKSSNPPVVR